MTSDPENSNGTGRLRAAFPIAASVVSLAGLADAAYLTAKHYSDTAVPCSVISGCEQVLTSAYAEMFGIPTAMFGAIAYFAAFSLSLLTVYGHLKLWNLFGLLTFVMTAFTIWFVYLQAFVIQAYCQFCLLSALSTFLLLVIFLSSKIFSRS